MEDLYHKKKEKGFSKMEKKINVLSLFDGISCGQIALHRAGIEINNYYAYEMVGQ